MGVEARYLVVADTTHDDLEACAEWLREYDALLMFPGVWVVNRFQGKAGDLARRLQEAAPRTPIFITALSSFTDYAGNELSASALRALDLGNRPLRSL